MYISTEKQFIYYIFNNTYYKVPTYGKIYKIIDYGRAIYKYNGKMMCSDSFHPKGDAASQYNFEPFFDSKKPWSKWFSNPQRNQENYATSASPKSAQHPTRLQRMAPKILENFFHHEKSCTKVKRQIPKFQQAG